MVGARLGRQRRCCVSDFLSDINWASAKSLGKDIFAWEVLQRGLEALPGLPIAPTTAIWGYSSSGEASFVKGWRGTLGATAVGKGIAVFGKAFGIPKMTYDVVTYFGALAVCFQ
jgi:hypothetical protein